MYSHEIFSTEIGRRRRIFLLPVAKSYSQIPSINLMHTLWTKIFGYAIHPKIPKGKADLRVADVGTGTG